MASVLVFSGGGPGGPGPGPCHALAEGRRVSSSAGATLHAAALIDPGESSSDSVIEAWLVRFGRGGADKVVLAQHSMFARPPTWSTHGDVLANIARHVSPVLILFASGALAHELAPRLAAALSGPFLADAELELDDDGNVFAVRAVSGGRTRRLAVEALGRPVVATLSPSATSPLVGDDDADLVLVEVADEHTDSPLTLIDSRPAPTAALERARVVVCAGAGVETLDNFALCEQLAAALGGEVAATLPAHRRGLAPAPRIVDISHTHVCPELYIACGASGSASHLAGVSPVATIVAINTDPSAPIFGAARFGIVGDVAAVIPELLELIARQGEHE